MIYILRMVNKRENLNYAKVKNIKHNLKNYTEERLFSVLECFVLIILEAVKNIKKGAVMKETKVYVGRRNVKHAELDTKWQKLKEWLEEDIEKNHKENEKTDLSVFLHYMAVEQCILQKMRELEGEDE